VTAPSFDDEIVGLTAKIRRAKFHSGIADVVAEITAELERLKRPPHANVPTCKALAWWAVCSMQAWAQDAHRDAIRRERDYARGIVDTIGGLERMLDTAPERLQGRLSPPEGLVQMGIVAPGECDLGALRRELSHLRRLCESYAAKLPAADMVKAWCAKEAALLVFNISRAAPANTDNSPLRAIAGLLYVTTDPARLAAWLRGERDHDMRRPCDAARRELRDMFLDPTEMCTNHPRKNLPICESAYPRP
jgi:hypothetical protein